MFIIVLSLCTSKLVRDSKTLKEGLVKHITHYEVNNQCESSFSHVSGVSSAFVKFPCNIDSIAYINNHQFSIFSVLKKPRLHCDFDQQMYRY